MREFRVLTGGYSAVYGGVAGGIVTVVTRAGANQLQGSLFEFFRNDAMDARGFFDIEKPDFTRHQFGASLGGPIVANHTFFFAAVEGLHERLGLTRVTTVPSAQARAGLLPDPARPGSTIAVNPLMRPYINLFPLSNGRDFGDGLAEYAFGALQKSDEAFGQLRIDHQLTANINAFGRYTFDDASKDEPTAFPGLPIDWDSRYHFATAQVDQIVSQHLVNTVRLGFSRTFIGQTDAGSRTTSLSVIPGRPLPQLQIGGMPNYGTLTASTTTASQDVWSLADEVSLSRGRHLFKIGGLLERFHADQDYQFYWGGRYTFPSVQRFVQGLPSVVLISLPGSDSVRELASTQFASYVHDDFRLASNLTLNLGVRWEFSTEPTEGRGLLVALPDPLHDTAVTQGELFRNHKANIAPRLGFAWSPGGRTIVSSAVGRYFDINSLPYIAQLLNNPPAFHQVTIANPAFPNTQFGSILPSLSVPSYDWRTPEMWHYNASVEHDLGKNMVVGRGVCRVARDPSGTGRRREHAQSRDPGRWHPVLSRRRAAAQPELWRDPASGDRQPLLVQRADPDGTPPDERRAAVPGRVHALQDDRRSAGEPADRSPRQYHADVLLRSPQLRSRSRGFRPASQSAGERGVGSAVLPIGTRSGGRTSRPTGR